jgi:inhibitor-of-growth protein 1
MQNQAAVEALYSATFVEDYLDCVENLPNNLQIFITKLREFDLIQYNEFLKDFGSLVTAFEQETTASGQRAILSKIQHGLILAQDIGDGKLSTVQVIINSNIFL